VISPNEVDSMHLRPAVIDPSLRDDRPPLCFASHGGRRVDLFAQQEPRARLWEGLATRS
jgi:hypothetical protein